MTLTRTRFRRIALSTQRRIREAQMIATAWDSPRRPILVHIIPVRQCNLSCTYCNEYDDFSKPVLTAEMVHRIDLLAALGSLSVHLSGGEPLLHPEVDRIIHHIRERGMFAGLLTAARTIWYSHERLYKRACVGRVRRGIRDIATVARSHTNRLEFVFAGMFDHGSDHIWTLPLPRR